MTLERYDVVGASLETIKLRLHDQLLQFRITVLVTLINLHRCGIRGRLLLELELELLLELLLVLCEFVTTVPSGVCSSIRSANLTFCCTGSCTRSRSPARVSDGAVSTILRCAICTL